MHQTNHRNPVDAREDVENMVDTADRQYKERIKSRENRNHHLAYFVVGDYVIVKQKKAVINGYEQTSLHSASSWG